METNGNGKVKLEHRLTLIEKDMEYIKRRVDNHIPHQINSLDEKVDKLTSSFSSFKTKNQRWINRILISVVLLLIGTIVNIFFK